MGDFKASSFNNGSLPNEISNGLTLLNRPLQ